MLFSMNPASSPSDLVFAADPSRVDGAIGKTPMVRLTRVVEPEMGEVWVKLEGRIDAFVYGSGFSNWLGIQAPSRSAISCATRE